MRKLLTAVALIGIGVLVADYGAWGQTSAGLNTRKIVNLYRIEKIEKKWHKAASKKNLNLMMSLWAKRAVFTYNGKTYRGKRAIRSLFAKAGPFQRQNHWISDTPEYKIHATVTGNKGTLYFECHYIDVDTKVLKVWVANQADLKKINGKWLIVASSASTPTLKP
jgi:ketosteroid isomerase-like protein